MPTSWYQITPVIVEQIALARPQSILDVGVGFGKYGVMIRDALELPLERYHKHQWKIRIDGIEAFPEYKNPIHEFVYNQVFYVDIRAVVNQLPKYDVILLIDVLEHFTKEEGLSLIRELLARTNKFVLISTPLYPAPQHKYLGNEYEEHKSRWTLTDFLDFDFSYRFIPIGDNGAQVLTLFPTHFEEVEATRDERRDQLLSPAIEVANNSLTIGYVLPHKNLTGGLKSLLEQMRHLQVRGHRVIALGRADGTGKVLPEWYPLEVEEISVPYPQSYLNYISSCDVVVLGWMSQTLEFVNSPVPVVYCERGYEGLFGDCRDLSPNSPVRKYLRECYEQSGYYLTATSSTIAKILKVRYGKEVMIIPNGVDADFYRPGCRPNDGTILLVGNPALWFKGFDVALRTLQKVWNSGHRFKVKWVCQIKPSVQGVNFPIEFIVNPPQEELAEHYRSADIFLFTSWYEGFGMPPLEAMASGVPVVSTLCGGVDMYAVPGENALLADPGDIDSLAYAVICLLQDEKAREFLAQKGRETALKFDIHNTIALWEDYLRRIVAIHKGNH